MKDKNSLTPAISSHGCTHIIPYKNTSTSNTSSSSPIGSTKTKPDIVKSYKTIIRWSLGLKNRHRVKDVLSDTNKISKKSEKIIDFFNRLPSANCKSCHNPFGTLHACLFCVFLGCWSDRHIHKHMSQQSHKFAVNLVTFAVYCLDCKDYIYDKDLEYLLNSEREFTENLINRLSNYTIKRPRFHSWQPSVIELEDLKSKSTPQVCKGPRGLRNMGSTCFMNVILQSFVVNPLLRAHFLGDNHNSKLCASGIDGEVCVTCEMDKLFQNVLTGPTTPFGPSSFLYSMWLTQSHLAGYSQQDAHEFFIAVVNQIHSSSIKQSESATSAIPPILPSPIMVSPNLITSSSSSSSSPSLNSPTLSSPSSAGPYIGRVPSSCTCIVHQTFAGILQSDVTCLKCGNVTTALDPFLDLSLDMGKGLDSIIQCLDKFTKAEPLDLGGYICGKCKETVQQATKQLRIKMLPPVLVLQLKRFEHGGVGKKVEGYVKIEEELNMKKYMSPDSKTILQSCDYRLFSVINHKGKIDTGHYTNFSKFQDQWFFFDDHSVTLSSLSTVLASDAYMCFYLRTYPDRINPSTSGNIVSESMLMMAIMNQSNPHHPNNNTIDEEDGNQNMVKENGIQQQQQQQLILDGGENIKNKKLKMNGNGNGNGNAALKVRIKKMKSDATIDLNINQEEDDGDETV